jgi:hypothetical protein
LSEGSYVPCTAISTSVGYTSSTITTVVSVHGETPNPPAPQVDTPETVNPAIPAAGTETAVLPPPVERPSPTTAVTQPTSSPSSNIGLPPFKGSASGKSSPVALSGFVAVLAVGWLVL